MTQKAAPSVLRKSCISTIFQPKKTGGAGPQVSAWSRTDELRPGRTGRSFGWELLGRLGDRGGAGRRRTGPNRRRAGAGGLKGGSGPTTSVRNAGRAFTNRMTAETLGVRADIACVIYICTWSVTTTRNGPKVVLTLFRSIGFQSYAVVRKANKRSSSFRCCIQLRTQPPCVAASPRCPDLTACPSVRQPRP